jgi:hypothetical protein
MHDQNFIFEHERRMSKLETTVKNHGELLIGISEQLGKVVKSTTDMKNWLIGAIAMLIIQQMGLAEGLKLIATKMLGGG